MNSETSSGLTTEVVGRISESDLRLLQRVQQLVEQARISQALLHAHLIEEYKLTGTRSVRSDGSICEMASEDAIRISA